MKSIKLNMILNVFRTAFTVFFPFIVFQYASRILLASNIGKVDFSLSVVNYFLLFAGLGIASYGIRESGKYVKDKVRMQQFASEIFTINIISTLISYIVLFLTILLVPKLHHYSSLIIIQSLIILFITIGLDWINIIYEDYSYITFRTLLSQIITLILVFIFVREKSDYFIFALISISGKIFPEILNFYHIRKHYFSVHLKFSKNLLHHIMPIIIIFFNSLVISIYVNLDTTMIGFFKTDSDVGYYSVAVKIYTAIKSIFSAIISVTVARMSLYYSNGQKGKVENLLSNMINYFTLLIIPTIVIVMTLAGQIIINLFGIGYTNSIYSLQILCGAIIFAVYASTITNSIFLPLGFEKYSLVATSIGAFINFSLNWYTIPYFGIEGAAITTLLAEFIVFLVTYVYLKKMGIIFLSYLSLKNILLTILISVWIIFINNILGEIFHQSLLLLMVEVIIDVLPFLLIFKSELLKRLS
ncbi:flippase [Streptococcus porcinus]